MKSVYKLCKNNKKINNKRVKLVNCMQNYTKVYKIMQKCTTHINNILYHVYM